MSQNNQDAVLDRPIQEIINSINQIDRYINSWIEQRKSYMDELQNHPSIKKPPSRPIRVFGLNNHTQGFFFRSARFGNRMEYNVVYYAEKDKMFFRYKNGIEEECPSSMSLGWAEICVAKGVWVELPSI